MEDTRCCGTGTCIINADGECWCGQRWHGTEMSYSNLDALNLDQPRQTILQDTAGLPS